MIDCAALRIQYYSLQNSLIHVYACMHALWYSHSKLDIAVRTITYNNITSYIHEAKAKESGRIADIRREKFQY